LCSVCPESMLLVSGIFNFRVWFECCSGVLASETA
jgi:hypothetical protein